MGTGMGMGWLLHVCRPSLSFTGDFPFMLFENRKQQGCMYRDDGPVAFEKTPSTSVSRVHFVPKVKSRYAVKTDREERNRQ